jgi:Tfp pilus assembly protein PilN
MAKTVEVKNQKKSKQINLLPKDEQRELKFELVSNQLIFFWSAVIVSLIVFTILAQATHIYLNNNVNKIQSSIDQDNQTLNSSDYKNIQNQIMALNQNIREIKNLDSQHYYWSSALVQLSNLISSDMQLNGITFDSGTGKIEITGQAKVRDSVLNFWSNVIKSDYFKNIDFPLNNLEKSKLSDFNFTFFANKTKFNEQ